MNTTLYRFSPWLLLAYTFLLCFFITQLPFDFEKFQSLNFDMLPRMVAGFSVLVVMLFHFGKFDLSPYFSREWVVYNLFLLTAFCAIYILFKDSAYGLNGLMGDASFNAAMVTKYKYFNTFTDFNYAQLSTSYPALYHFILGKYAALFRIESYTAVHHGYIIAYCIFSIPVFLLANHVAGEWVAAAFVMFMFLNFPADNLYKPYEFITACIFLFWWMGFVEKPFSVWKQTLVGGLIGAAIFTTYYYWFFIAATYLLLKIPVEFSANFSFSKTIENRKNTLLILLSAALFSAFYWLPLGFQFAKFGVVSLQNMWMTGEMVEFSFLKEQSLLVNMVLGAGAVVAFLNRDDKFLSVSRWVLVTLGVWFTLGYFMLYIGKPTVANKMHYLLYAVCAFNAFYFLFHKTAFRLWKEKQAASAVIFSALFMVGIDNFLELKNHAFFKSLHAYPSPLHQADEAFVKQFKGKVMLTDRQYISAFVPVHYFININAHFSHPASQFRERLKFLEDLQQIQNGDAVAWFLAHNKFDKTDLIFFAGSPALTVYDDNYPWGHKATNISLTPNLLTSVYVQPFGEMKGEAGTIYQITPPPVELKNSFGESENLLVKKYTLQ